MALAAKQQVRKPTASKQTDSTAKDSPISPTAHGRTTSFLDSDSTTSDEEQDEEQQLLQAVHQEVLMYFGEHPLSKKENPLTWWEKNAARYPTVAELARSLLSIPATSTPSERLFSAAGNIVSKKRASLSPEHVDMLTFLHCNKELL
ncbi:E3 SUMO-protein ligase ZBED1-like [Corythoichthys intestinalis]|uniref:E3 SUMO-protein ligase ZBED1-like n=1 Tax=Corythoichthys intestinalis TaxID=161448 RepID=UPI0025A5E58C|nr:E3 SUMO-protein ligase ZBED1-like [Corythoichthys intestinalis]